MWGQKELKRPSNDTRNFQDTRGSSEHTAIVIEKNYKYLPIMYYC